MRRPKAWRRFVGQALRHQLCRIRDPNAIQVHQKSPESVFEGLRRERWLLSFGMYAWTLPWALVSVLRSAHLTLLLSTTGPRIRSETSFLEAKGVSSWRGLCLGALGSGSLGVSRCCKVLAWDTSFGTQQVSSHLSPGMRNEA